MQDSVLPRTIALDGERVRAHRLRTASTREALSAKSFGADALSVATIKRAESGKPLYANTVASLARLLNVSVEDLLPASATPEPAPRQAARHAASVAIMPFSYDAGQPGQRVFVDGFVEETINRLSSFWFPVIARGSTFSWQDEGAEPSDVHHTLGADYLVRGSLRSDGSLYRTTAQLHEAATGRVVWSASFDTKPSALFELRDQIVAKVVSEIGNSVLSLEAERAAQMDSAKLDAWHTALRGAWHFHRCTPADLQTARGYLHQALEDAPQLAFARYLLVLSHQHDLLNQWSADPRATLQEMRQASLAFERTSPGSTWMYVATAYTAVALGERVEARTRLLEALETDSNSVQAHSLYGQVLAMGGQCDQGLHELGLARTLSPRDPGTWTVLLTTSLAHFAAGRYEPAVEWAQRAIANRPHVPFPYAALAAALAHHGEVGEARLTLRKLLERQAHLDRRGMTPIIGATDPEIARRFLDGLRLAGMPEDA